MTRAPYEARGGELEGYETWVLGSRDGELSATFAPRAGMAGCSLAHAGEELLHLGGGLAEYARSGATMGIPLLHPWANRLGGFEYGVDGRTVVLDRTSPLIQVEENGLPIHGLLAASPRWSVQEAGADDSAAWLRAELDFGAHEDLLAGFPFPHLLRLESRLEGSELELRTTVEPTADVDVPVAFGFHPYLLAPGVPREQWRIELPVRMRLVLDEQMIPTGESEPFAYDDESLGERAFDDSFEDIEPPGSFALEAGGRRIAVTFGEGYPFAQVYSPPGGQFICFEPMTAPTNALRSGDRLPLAPAGGSFSAVFRISVERT